ncbi:MAG: phage tail sheath subtilisin-like domain-containing protein [Acidiferrobacterales bacterium]
MAMTKFLSPGVFTTEIDQSFLAQGVAGIGAALVGQTLKGPAFVPIIVGGFDQFSALFGATDPTGSMQMPYTAQNYLQNAGTLTVVRVLGSDDGLSINSGYIINPNGGPAEVAIVDTTGSAAKILAVLHLSGSASITDVGDHTDFVLNISGPATFAATASFLPSSPNYIANVLNTNPSLFSVYGHYVYRSYSFVTPTALAVFSALSSNSGSFLRDYTDGLTAWVKSQPVGGMDFNLFRFHTRGHGRATNDDIRVQISNIQVSPNPNSTPYGTFDLQVRAFYDTDQRPNILESFIGCTLDPRSPNFVARRVGDQFELFDTVQRKMIQYGNFPNNSQLIHIEMAVGTNPPQQALPWGHRGYQAQAWADPGDPSAAKTILDVPLPLVPNQFNLQGTLDTSIIWGILNTSISGGIVDRMRAFPDNEIPGGVFQAPSDPDFSLAYITSSYLNGQQVFTYNVAAGLNSVPGATGSTSWSQASSSLYAFSLPFQGGFDGWDLRNPLPTYLNNGDNLASLPQIPNGAAFQTGGGNAIASLNRAIDTLANPDAFDMNLLAVPGVNCLTVTDHARTMVNNRMDAMYVMDITGSSVTQAIQLLQTRNIDDNYTACYYPDLKLNDTVSNLVVRVAPSVAVMGAMAYNDRVGQVFFAPAGLNRGGLNQFGVIDVVDRLTFSDRDNLYTNRINPIATFPNEGIVVWGQKTLQVKASALDRVNVRRLLIYAKKTVASAAAYLLFEPNNPQTWQRFINLVNPILAKIQQDQGLNRFKVVMDSSTNPGYLVDQNIMTGKIFLQPTTAAEFIDLSFIITSSGVSFGS